MYAGGWRQGQRHGDGRLTRADGSVAADGEFAAGRLVAAARAAGAGAALGGPLAPPIRALEAARRGGGEQKQDLRL